MTDLLGSLYGRPTHVIEYDSVGSSWVVIKGPWCAAACYSYISEHCARCSVDRALYRVRGVGCL